MTTKNETVIYRTTFKNGVPITTKIFKTDMYKTTEPSMYPNVRRD